jgi:hypothetical protein
MNDLRESKGAEKSIKRASDAHYPSDLVEFASNPLPEPDLPHSLPILLEPPEKAPSETSPNPGIKVERGGAFSHLSPVLSSIRNR